MCTAIFVRYFEKGKSTVVYCIVWYKKGSFCSGDNHEERSLENPLRRRRRRRRKRKKEENETNRDGRNEGRKGDFTKKAFFASPLGGQEPKNKTLMDFQNHS